VDGHAGELHAVYILQAWNQLEPNAVRPLRAFFDKS